MEEIKLKKFNLKITPLFLVMFVIFIAVTIIQMVRDGFNGEIVRMYYVALPVLILVFWVLAFILSKIYGTKIIGDSITASNRNGKRISINLFEIEVVVESNIFGLRHAKLLRKGLVLEEIFLPLYHKHQMDLEETLIHKCGFEHPLTEFILGKNGGAISLKG